VKIKNTRPVDFYKSVSDNSVRTDKTDLSDNEQKGIVSPKTLHTNLIIGNKDKDNKDKSNNKVIELNSTDPNAKTKKNVTYKIKSVKKFAYNPTDDIPNNTHFEPYKLQKKLNPNDANLVDSAAAIRKFKDLENRFVDLEVNKAQDKISKSKTIMIMFLYKFYTNIRTLLLLIYNL